MNFPTFNLGLLWMLVVSGFAMSQPGAMAVFGTPAAASAGSVPEINRPTVGDIVTCNGGNVRNSNWLETANP